jgi:SAM-dependent methyltransferase
MSVFSSVDSVGDATPVVAYLDHTARAASGMKHYAMAAHTLREPDAPVLDLGCGAGHDLALLAGAGMRAVGVDPSAALLSAAQDRLAGAACLVRSIGEALPFGDGSLAGCRIERVLMHVADPGAVVAEVARCLRAGGLLTVFEPDWGSFRVRGGRGDQATSWIANARHPEIGGVLWELVERSGIDVLDRVEETSVWRKLDVLDRVVGLETAVERAIRADRTVVTRHARGSTSSGTGTPAASSSPPSPR